MGGGARNGYFGPMDRTTGTEAGPRSRWDERYAGDEFFFGTEPNDFLVDLAPRLPAGRTLCIADGEGRNSVFLAAKGHDVTAMDASVVGMEKAAALAAARGVELATVVADLRDFDFSLERWDAIVSIFCHMPPDLRRDVHARAVEGLAPGGAFVLEAYTPDQLAYRTGGPPVAELLMTEADLRADLAGLSFELLAERLRTVREGRGHDGPSAVVQVFGWKR